MICQKCGQSLPDDANFCSNCGARVERSDQSRAENAGSDSKAERKEIIKHYSQKKGGNGSGSFIDKVKELSSRFPWIWGALVAVIGLVLLAVKVLAAIPMILAGILMIPEINGRISFPNKQKFLPLIVIVLMILSLVFCFAHGSKEEGSLPDSGTPEITDGQEGTAEASDTNEKQDPGDLVLAEYHENPRLNAFLNKYNTVAEKKAEVSGVDSIASTENTVYMMVDDISMKVSVNEEEESAWTVTLTAIDTTNKGIYAIFRDVMKTLAMDYNYSDFKTSWTEMKAKKAESVKCFSYNCTYTKEAQNDDESKYGFVVYGADPLLEEDLENYMIHKSNTLKIILIAVLGLAIIIVLRKPAKEFVKGVRKKD